MQLQRGVDVCLLLSVGSGSSESLPHCGCFMTLDYNHFPCGSQATGWRAWRDTSSMRNSGTCSRSSGIHIHGNLRWAVLLPVGPSAEFFPSSIRGIVRSNGPSPHTRHDDGTGTLLDERAAPLSSADKGNRDAPTMRIQRLHPLPCGFHTPQGSPPMGRWAAHSGVRFPAAVGPVDRAGEVRPMGEPDALRLLRPVRRPTPCRHHNGLVHPGGPNREVARTRPGSRGRSASVLGCRRHSPGSSSRGVT